VPLGGSVRHERLHQSQERSMSRARHIQEIACNRCGKRLRIVSDKIYRPAPRERRSRTRGKRFDIPAREAQWLREYLHHNRAVCRMTWGIHRQEEVHTFVANAVY
jgi:hypothetical protein